MSRVSTAVVAMARQIGFDIALAHDTAQADLLNGLAEGFESYMPQKQERDMQVVYVVAKLTPAAKRLIAELHGFSEVSE